MLRRAEHHACVQHVLIGERRQLHSPRCPRGAFERLHAAQVRLSHALVVRQGTGLWLRPGLVHALSHIDRQAQPHLPLARMSCRMPGSLVLGNDLGEFWQRHTRDPNQQGEP